MNYTDTRRVESPAGGEQGLARAGLLSTSPPAAAPRQKLRSPSRLAARALPLATVSRELLRARGVADSCRSGARLQKSYSSLRIRILRKPIFTRFVRAASSSFRPALECMCWGLPSGTRLHALLVQLEERRLQNRVSNASVRGICTPSHRGPSLSGGLRLEPNRLESKHGGRGGRDVRVDRCRRALGSLIRSRRRSRGARR